jgi:glycosyltransferase involved in cell wall biosynthesis
MERKSRHNPNNADADNVFNDIDNNYSVVSKNRNILLEYSVDSLDKVPDVSLVIKSEFANHGNLCQDDYIKPASISIVREWQDYVLQADADCPEFIVFIDGRNSIIPNALSELFCLLHRVPDADLLYADEFIVHSDGSVLPFHKPGWAPELLLSFQYIGLFFAVRGEIFRKLGGFRPQANSSVILDFLLRVSECTDKVAHLPRPLGYRKSATSASSGLIDDSRKAIEQALARRGTEGKARLLGNGVQLGGEPAFQLEFPNKGPQVAILVAGRNRVDLFRRCVNSIQQKTSYENYSIYIVDNDSDDPETIEWFAQTSCRILRIPSPNGVFSFANLYNTAIRQIDEPLVLLLNNDTEVISARWLADMVGYACMPGVGSVGARLVFGNDELQHCGIIHNVNHGFPSTAFRHMPASQDGYWRLSRLASDHMAQTAACLLTHRDLYLGLGGLDETNFSVAFNDCDYGYRLHRAGYRNVFCPTAELYHLENASRGSGDKPQEEAAYIRKYGGMPDAYHNPNFAAGSVTYAVSSRCILPATPPPIRAAMVMHDLTRTGACRNACFLATELARRKSIRPVIISHLDGPLRPLLENAGLEVRILPHFHLLGSKNESELMSHLNEMVGWLADVEPELVYGNTILTFWAMGAAARLDVPCVWNIRESETPFSHLDEHGAATKTFSQQCMQYPYQNIFVADATKRLFEPWHKNANAVTVHNGFDRSYFIAECAEDSRDSARKSLGLRDDDLYILIVGTICERKGQADAFEAFTRLDERIASRCRLGIVGGEVDTPYRRALMNRRESLSDCAKERIVFDMAGGSIEHHYLAADIYICSSRIESFPRVIQEAMACNLPIITTPVFGVVEQVRNNVSALFYEPGDIDTLSRHLQTLITDPDLRAELGKQAGISLDILPDTKTMVDQYERLFREAWLYGRARKGSSKRFCS